jgi:hypothetical protein
MSQMDLVRILNPHLFQTHSNIYANLNDIFPWGFLIKFYMRILSLPCCSRCTTGLINPTVLGWSRENSVGITMGYGLDGPGIGVQFQAEARGISFYELPDRLWGPPRLLSIGNRALLPLRVPTQYPVQWDPDPCVKGAGA